MQRKSIKLTMLAAAVIIPAMGYAFWVGIPRSHAGDDQALGLMSAAPVTTPR